MTPEQSRCTPHCFEATGETQRGRKVLRCAKCSLETKLSPWENPANYNGPLLPKVRFGNSRRLHEGEKLG